MLLGLMMIAFLSDSLTTYEINVGPLYLVVVCYAAWNFGWIWASITAVAACLLWWLSDVATGHSYSRAWIVWQQMGTRLVTYVTIAFAISIYRRTLEAHRRRLAVLERVLIVCPACGRIGPREGGWMHADDFVRQSEERYRFCPDCIRVPPAHGASHSSRT